MAFAPEEIHQLLTHVVDETAVVCAAIGKEIQGPPRTQQRSAQSQSQTGSAPAQ
jgi:hypothetical protein